MNEQHILYYVNDWCLDKASGSIIHKERGEQKRLGEYQLKLMLVLAQHAGNVISREQLSQLVWEGRVIGNNSLPNAIHALRIALEDDGKHQRIIKTIPKRGYLLEKEFCSTQQINIDTSHLPSPPMTEESITKELIQTELLKKSSRSGAILDRIKTGFRYRFRWIIIILTLLILLMLFHFYFHKPNFITINDNIPSFYVQPIKQNAWPHIALYNVKNEREISNNDALPNNRIQLILTPTFDSLESLLATRENHVTIYYHVTNATLYFSFIVNNRCQRRKLSMAIDHWHHDNNYLNNLIQKETTRKLNELVDCYN